MFKMLRVLSQINLHDNPVWRNNLLLLEAAVQEDSSVEQGCISLLSHWPDHLLCYLGDANTKREVSKYKRLSTSVLSAVNWLEMS